MRTRLFSSIALAAIIGLTGCGESSSQDKSTAIVDITGKFIDSAVWGLEYLCTSGVKGLTDSSGSFTCKSGDRVSFSVNGFEIGSANAAAIITPQSLYPDDNTSMINLARFLQTLDSDGNPENGIILDTNDTKVMAFDANVSVDFSQNDFESVMKSYLGVDLVDEVNATVHLNLTLQNIQNGLGDVTANSMIAIANNATPEMCQRNTEAKYQGYASYEEFINSGGSYAQDYFSSSKSCSEYGGAGSCQEVSVDPIIGGTGSCVLVVTFPETQNSEDNSSTGETQSSTIIPPNLSHTVTVPSLNLVTVVDKDYYVEYSQENVKYVNATTNNVLWTYDRVDYSESIQHVIKVTQDSVIIRTEINAKEVVLFLNKNDGSELQRIETGLLGTADLTSDNANVIVQNGWDFKLLDASGALLLEKSAPIYGMNATELFLNNLSSQTLSAYTFEGSLLWEQTRECREMFFDDSALYCQNNELNSSVTLSKLDAQTGELLMKRNLSQTLFEVFMDTGTIYANENSWNTQGYYVEELIALKKSDLSEVWRKGGKNIIGMDVSKKLLYSNNVYNELVALDTTDGSDIYVTTLAPYTQFGTLKDGSIVTYGVTLDKNNDYLNEYNVYTY